MADDTMAPTIDPSVLSGSAAPAPDMSSPAAMPSALSGAPDMSSQPQMPQNPNAGTSAQEQDMNANLPSTAARNTPNPTAPLAGGAPSIWKDLVMGALHGLAGSAGAKHFGAGLAGGAEGEFKAQQQATENKQNAQKLQFESVAAADSHIHAADEHTRANQLSDEDKLDYKQKSAGYQAFMQDNFGIEPDLSFNDTHADAIGAMDTTAQSNGGKMPPVTTVQQPSPDGTHGTIAVYSPSTQQMQQNSAGYRELVNTSRRVQGLSDIDTQSWNSLGFKGQRDQAQSAIEFMKPTPAFSLDRSKPDYISIVQATKEQQLQQYMAHKDANGEATQAAAVTTAQQGAMLPFKEQDQRFQTNLARTTADLNRTAANNTARNLEADKMALKEDTTRDSDLKNIGDLRDNIAQIDAGNQVALGTAQVKFAEHEIVEGGVKRMNETELHALTSGTGTFGRQMDAWKAQNFEGDMPTASKQDMLQILQNETDSRNALHDKNVSSIDGRIRPKNQTISAPASSQKSPASSQKSPASSPAVQAVINKHAGGQ